MDSLTQRLKALSSAEDFSALLRRAVRRARGAGEPPRTSSSASTSTCTSARDLAGLDEIEMFRRYREHAAAARMATSGSSNAGAEKVFKVFQEADGQMHRAGGLAARQPARPRLSAAA